MRDEELNPFGGSDGFNPFGDEGLGLDESIPSSGEVSAPEAPQAPDLAYPAESPLGSAPPSLDPGFSPFGSDLPSTSSSSPEPSANFIAPPPSFDSSPPTFDSSPPSFEAPPASFDSSPPSFETSPPSFEAPLSSLEAPPAFSPGGFTNFGDSDGSHSSETSGNEVVAVAEVVGRSLSAVSDWLGSNEILAVEEIAESIDDSELFEEKHEITREGVESGSNLESRAEAHSEIDSATGSTEAQESVEDSISLESFELTEDSENFEPDASEFNLDSDFPGVESEIGSALEAEDGHSFEPDVVEAEASSLEDVSMPDFEESPDDPGEIDLSFDGDDTPAVEASDSHDSGSEEAADLSEFDFGFGGDEETPSESAELVESAAVEAEASSLEDVSMPDFEEGSDDLGEIDLSFDGDDEDDTPAVEASGSHDSGSEESIEQLDLDSDFGPNQPLEMEMDPLLGDELEFQSSEEKELADFIEEEQLVERLKEVSQEEHSFKTPVESESPTIDQSDTLLIETDPEPQMDIQDQQSASVSNAFQLPVHLLNSLSDSAYLLEDGFIEIKTAPLAIAQSRSSDLNSGTSHLSKSINRSQDQLSDDVVEEYKIGQWDTYLAGSFSLLDLKKRLSTVFLENKEILPDLMGYCESIGLIQGNFKATYLLSEIHKEIGESLSVISLKMECLAQLKQSEDNQSELQVCLELQDYLPLDEGLVSRTLNLYSALDHPKDREDFLLKVLARYKDFNHLDLAKKLFEYCECEGLNRREFWIAGLDLYSALGFNKKVLEIFTTIESAFGLDSPLALKKGEVLEQEGDHVKALEQYKHCLSQADEPVPVMEKIIVLLEKMGRFDQLGGFLNQLLSLDSMNEVGLALSEKLRKGQEKSATSSIDVERLERRIEELLDTKLSALMKGEALTRSKVAEKSIIAPTKSYPKDLEDPFAKDLNQTAENSEQSVYFDALEGQIEEDFIQVDKIEASETQETSFVPIAEEKLDQSASLIFLKEAQRKLSAPGNLSSSELRILKAEALQHAQNIHDPVLGFFWTGEINKF